MQAQGTRDALEVQRALEEILLRDAKPEVSLWERLMKWAEEFFSFSWEPSSTAPDWLGNLAKLVVFLAALGLMLLVTRLVAHQWAERRRQAEREELELPVLERVALLRMEAQDARRAGQWKLALQKQFFALVLGLGERGDLEFRDAWTNRELLALGSPAPGVQRVLGPLLEELEPKEFGRVEVQAEDLDRLEALASEYFGALGGLAR